MSKFASLSAGLLARKGEAEPVVTPFADQLLTRAHAHIEPGAPVKVPMLKSASDGATPIFGAFGRWSAQEIARDREERLPRIGKPPASDGVRGHDDEDPAGAHCGVCADPVADEIGKSYHVNLRMKRPRFVKLKLSSALLRKPVQEIVAEALDAWFDKLPPDVLGDCACMKVRGD